MKIGANEKKRKKEENTFQFIFGFLITLSPHSFLRTGIGVRLIEGSRTAINLNGNVIPLDNVSKYN